MLKLAATLLISVALAGCSASGRAFRPAHAVAPTGQGKIFVYRPDQFTGGGYTAKITLDGEVMGRLKNAGYLAASVPPGRHIIEIDKMFFETGGRYPTPIDVEAGKSYFVRYDQRAVFMGTGMSSMPVTGGVLDGFNIIPPEDAVKELATLKESR